MNPDLFTIKYYLSRQFTTHTQSENKMILVCAKNLRMPEIRTQN